MATKLYVGNLSWSTTEETLTEAFSRFGELVKVEIPRDALNRSRGFAFVEYSTPEAAEAAIKGMHDADLDGRTLRVNDADQKPAPKAQNKKKLFVGNLPWRMTEADLTEMFSEVGTVASARVARLADGKSRGIAFVEMDTEELAEAAIERFNGADLEGRAMTVNVAQPPKPKTDRPNGFSRGNGGGYSRNDYNSGGY